jgi:hypothetical protein
MIPSQQAGARLSGSLQPAATHRCEGNDSDRESGHLLIGHLVIAGRGDLK